MSKRFHFDKQDAISVAKGAAVAASGAIGAWLIVKSNEWFSGMDDATKLMFGALTAIAVNAVRRLISGPEEK